MEFLKTYLNNLHIYDYIGFGLVGVAFLLFFIISLILLFKKPIVGFILMMLTLAILPIGFFGVYKVLNNTVRKSKIIIKKVKPLHFSNSLLVEAEIKNLSKIEFGECFIEFKIFKKSKSKIKNFIYGLKPLVTRSIYIYDLIPKDSSYEFKKILNGATYTPEENLTAKMDCY